MCRVAPSRRGAGAQGQGRDRRPGRRRAPFRPAERPVPVGHPTGALRAGAVPEPGAPVPAGRLRPRRAPLPVLQPAGREHRPRHPPVARRRAHLGERGRVLPALQRPQGEPLPPRDRPAPPAAPGRTPLLMGGHERRPHRSRPGSPISRRPSSRNPSGRRFGGRHFSGSARPGGRSCAGRSAISAAPLGRGGRSCAGTLRRGLPSASLGLGSGAHVCRLRAALVGPHGTSV